MSDDISLPRPIPGPLRGDCGRGQLHATLNPMKWKGDRWWIVALHGEVIGDDLTDEVELGSDGI